MKLSKEGIIKALISLRGCAGWSAPLLFAHSEDRFSRDVASSRGYNVLHFNNERLSNVFNKILLYFSDESFSNILIKIYCILVMDVFRTFSIRFIVF